MEDYQSINRKYWNSLVDDHVDGAFYQMERWLGGWNSLNSIELDLLGSVKGLKILHLQCHFGQDTLSLARMGASVTGVDLSDKAIEKAKQLSRELGLDARFICCDIFELDDHLDESFDIVFTSYGTIGWLPKLLPWARIIDLFLKPGGRFIMADFHPFVWMMDEHFGEIKYDYFNREMIVEESNQSYGQEESHEPQKNISWNHPTSEVIAALRSRNLLINEFLEFDYSPYNCFKDLNEDEPGKFRTKKHGHKLPMVFAIEAAKPM